MKDILSNTPKMISTVLFLILMEKCSKAHNT